MNEKMLDKYKKFNKFTFPKETDLGFKLQKSLVSYADLYNICNMCARGVAVDIAFKATNKMLAFKILKQEAKYFQEDDAAKLLDFCYMFYYQSLAQVQMNIHTIACSNANNSTQAARLLLEYEKILRDDDEMKRRQLL